MLLRENFVSRLTSVELYYDDAHDSSLATTILIKSRMKDVGLTETFDVRPSRRARHDIDTSRVYSLQNSLQNYLKFNSLLNICI